MKIIRDFLLKEMVDAGELIARGEFYEDMGGHLCHESNLDGHIEQFIKSLTEDERKELFERMAE